MAKPSNNFFENFLIAWSIIGPILGGIVGFFIRRWHIKYQIRQQEFQNACRDFERAFTPEIQRIERINKISFTQKEIIDVLSASSNKHKEAAIEFKRQLVKNHKRKIAAFEKCWTSFSCEDYEKRGLPKHYGYDLYTPDRTPTLDELKKNALKKIETVLNFAKY